MTAAVAVVVFVVGGFGLPRTDGSGESLPDAASGTAADRMSIGEAVSFFSDRVAANPGDALSATVLSELYVRRGREMGDISDYTRAAEAAGQALDRLPEHAQAHLALANAQLALHQFDSAETSAAIADDLDPSLGAEVVVADVAVATGDLDRAAEIYTDLDVRFDSPALEARIARVSELRGDHEQAIELMELAVSQSARLGQVGEPAAWLRLRLGDLAFETGDYPGAQRRYEEALQIFDPYPAAEAGRARSLAAQGRYDEAADAYERSIELQPVPDVLLAAARMYEHIGEDDTARLHRATLDAIARLSDGLYDLAHIHHLIDERRSDEALEVAERQTAIRKDAYSLDALAWAQYHVGDVASAADTVTRLLDSSIADPRVLFHAGVILWETDHSTAVDLIERALATSPEFDPIDAPRARDLLQHS